MATSCSEMNPARISATSDKVPALAFWSVSSICSSRWGSNQLRRDNSSRISGWTEVSAKRLAIVLELAGSEIRLPPESECRYWP